jgi:hypothetical protein
MICTCGRTRAHCRDRQRCLLAIGAVLIMTICACLRVRAGLSLVRPAGAGVARRP